MVCTKHSLSLLCQTPPPSFSTWPHPPPPPPPPLLFGLSFFFLPPFSRCLSGSLRLAANNAGVVRYHRLLLLRRRRVEAAQGLSSKRQTPVFCHLFDCYPSVLRTSPLCLRHSPCSDPLCLTVCLSEGKHFCSWEKRVCVCIYTLTLTLCSQGAGV